MRFAEGNPQPLRYRVSKDGSGFRVVDTQTRHIGGSWDKPSRRYTDGMDASHTVNWLNERAAGYPIRNLPWPPADFTRADWEGMGVDTTRT